MLLSEAITQYVSWINYAKRESTRKSYRYHLMQFALYMNNCNVEQINLGNILGYLDTMTVIGWDRDQYMPKCIALRKFFEFLGKQKISNFDYTLIPIIEKENYKLPKVAIPEDYYKVLKAIPDNNDPRHIRNKLMLMMFKDTGMRLSENLSLNRDMVVTKRQVEVRDKDGIIVEVKTLFSTTVVTKKSKRPHPIREVFWTPETQKQLEKWLKKLQHLEKIIKGIDLQALYISVTGIKCGHRLNKSGATEVMRRLSHEAGLLYVMNSHSLRHLFGHDMGKSGLQDSNVSILLGHANPQSSYIYRLLNSPEMANLAANTIRS